MKKGLFGLFLLFVFFAPVLCFSQYSYDKEYEPELSAGIKGVHGKFSYGPLYFETNGLGGPGFQPTIRYDYPLRLFTINDHTSYLSLTASTGVLIAPTKRKPFILVDGNTGAVNTLYTKTPVWLPVYFGFYNPGSFGIGVEAFYAKGLNNIEDIWGAKLVSMSYSHRRFRIDAAYEMYLQVKTKREPEYFFSLEFLWKLNRNKDY
ncbi:MAG TPA: hypothetical protein PKA77_17285 [Chitinophagaceae bacterium]|jgi:hypothetical protein|nr:hypothetical protein [Chitinophagaceae bacterium]HMU59926.1 hypothetical protein [Chitinophagaceae bacterium]